MDEIVARDPTTALYLPHAERLRARGFVDEAIRLCEERRTRPGRGVGDHIVLGRSYLAAGRLAEAAAAFRAALDLDRENIVALKALAGIEAHEGRYGEAAEFYRAVCRVDPGDLEAQTALHQLTSAEYEEVRPPEMIVSQGGLSWQPVRLPREEEHLAELALGLRTIRDFGAEPRADRPLPAPRPDGPTEIALERLEPTARPGPESLTESESSVAPEPTAIPESAPAPESESAGSPSTERGGGRFIQGNRTAFEDWIRQIGAGR